MLADDQFFLRIEETEWRGPKSQMPEHAMLFNQYDRVILQMRFSQSFEISHEQ
jgi:hypothetical protein